jgi:uncharacterized membrane protein
MLVRATQDRDKALAALHAYGGTVIRTTLPGDAEERLRTALGRVAAGASGSR